MSRRRHAPSLGRALVLTLAILAGPLLNACSEDESDDTPPAPSPSTSARSPSPTTTALAGVETFPVPSRLHVQGPVMYPQVPPVGGDHNPVWQNCGFYSRPVEPERAVHSLEHGAVWITYRPDLPTEQVDILRHLARSRTHILVSPWPDATLPSPVVASAWGVQLKPASASDPGLATFIDIYAGGGRSPEPGAPCAGGFGAPE